MAEFGYDEREYYSQRDDRTNRCGATLGYQMAHCAIVLNSERACTYEGQVMTLAACNLLSRWCRTISLVIPDVVLVKPLSRGRYRFLRERIWDEIRAADPFGQFAFMGHIPKNALTLSIGEHVGDWTIDGCGWVGALGRPGTLPAFPKEPRNPVGPGIAACLGIAQLFRAACGLNVDASSQFFYSALSLRSVLPQTHNGPEVEAVDDIGRVLQVGVGSVGSSFLYFLTMSPIRGTWILVDHDVVKLVNLNRSLLFGVSDCGMNKAKVASAFLKSGDICALPFGMELKDFLKIQPRTPNCWDIVLPLANEFGARWNIQNLVPPLVIYGTTTSDWGINFGRHIPLVEDCLVCRYPNDSWQPQYICGAGSTTEELDHIDAALPFTSALAGLLLLAELLKSVLSDYPFNHNFAYLDLKQFPFFSTHYNMPPHLGCVCASQRRLFGRYNNGTKYSSLSVSSLADG